MNDQRIKRVFKISLINLAVVLVFSVFFCFGILDGTASDFIIIFGVMCFLVGVVDIIAALILLATKKTETAQGLFLSAGILLLLGFTACSTAY